jgi:hypothetical protein
MEMPSVGRRTAEDDGVRFRGSEIAQCTEPNKRDLAGAWRNVGCVSDR